MAGNYFSGPFGNATASSTTGAYTASTTMSGSGLWYDYNTQSWLDFQQGVPIQQKAKIRDTALDWLDRRVNEMRVKL